MTRPAVNPLDGIDRLLIDGTNLLYAIRRRGDDGGAPAAALVGRIRAVVPAGTAIELVFDGRPEPGMRGTRVASGVVVRYGGRLPADDVLLGLVDEARAVAGARGADNILVVSDDRDLRLALRDRGAATARAAWLIGRLERRTLEAPAPGNPRPPRAAGAEPSDPEADDGRRPWRPGRGATAKRGNPRRPPHRRRRRPIGG